LSFILSISSQYFWIFLFHSSIILHTFFWWSSSIFNLSFAKSTSDFNSSHFNNFNLFCLSSSIFIILSAFCFSVASDFFIYSIFFLASSSILFTLLSYALFSLSSFCFSASFSSFSASSCAFCCGDFHHQPPPHHQAHHTVVFILDKSISQNFFNHSLALFSAFNILSVLVCMDDARLQKSFSIFAKVSQNSTPASIFTISNHQIIQILDPNRLFIQSDILFIHQVIQFTTFLNQFCIFINATDREVTNISQRACPAKAIVFNQFEIQSITNKTICQKFKALCQELSNQDIVVLNSQTKKFTVFVTTCATVLNISDIVVKKLFKTDHIALPNSSVVCKIQATTFFKLGKTSIQTVSHNCVSVSMRLLRIHHIVVDCFAIRFSNFHHSPVIV
jgi:hypothetical protein